MIAPAYAVVEDDPAAAPQPAIAGDGMKYFFEGVLMRIFRYEKSMTAFTGLSLENVSKSVSRAEVHIDELIEKKRT